MVLTDAEGVREEVDLSLPGRRHVSDVPPAPGSSVLDGVLEDLSVLEEGAPAPRPAADAAASDEAASDDAATLAADDDDADDEDAEPDAKEAS